eukprot:CAMPEP_0183338828 /NCGR_PEP_ID=MMETSP0164_2-20130417/5982_1 /TAXON_ID=221442 /ORGANISM="Coccolithus pelagicus ssp braarudi, Strain PLY182g" /LENGTH=289 /DNA_ID=CAMNT_0025508739 /DNA_START=16 /DNA_END=885 /DNA_ORIENTATION=-
MQLVLLGALPLLVQAAPPSLLRFSSMAPKVQGLGCIPVSLERLLAPGLRRTIHLYDSSCLAAFRHAIAHTNGTLGHVVLNVERERRQFGLLDVGCELRVLEWRASTHTSKFGDSSPSVLADVIATRRFRPGKVVQFEPFLSVGVEPFGGEGAPSSESADAPADKRADDGGGSAALTQLSGQLHHLGAEISNLRAELQLEPVLQEDCERALALVDADGEMDEADLSRARLLAFASTRFLSAEQKWEALARTAGLALVEGVVNDLDEATARLRAMKVLRDSLGGPDESPVA